MENNIPVQGRCGRCGSTQMVHECIPMENTDKQLREEAAANYPTEGDPVNAEIRQAYIDGRKQSLSELSEKDKEIDELQEKAWDAKIMREAAEDALKIRDKQIEELKAEIEQLEADKKQVAELVELFRELMPMATHLDDPKQLEMYRKLAFLNQQTDKP